jgi:hypothetical protein
LGVTTLLVEHSGNAEVVAAGPIPWRFETALLSRFGASCKVCFSILPA